MFISRNRRRRPAALLVAAVAATAAVVTSPVAVAEAPDCRSAGNLRTCSKDGHNSLRVTPQPRPNLGQLFSPNYVPGFGEGIPVTPILG